MQKLDSAEKHVRENLSENGPPRNAAKASLTSVFMACFTQFPFVEYARLSFVTPSNA